MKLSAKLLPQILTVRALSPKARTDLMIAAIPFALALAAKGLEALERHIAGRLIRLTELELAIAELGDQLGHADPSPSAPVRPPASGSAQAPAEGDGTTGDLAHPMGCVREDPHDPHDPGACEFPTPDKVSVDDQLVDTQCRVAPGCTIPFPHEHAPNYGAAIAAAAEDGRQRGDTVTYAP